MTIIDRSRLQHQLQEIARHDPREGLAIARVLLNAIAYYARHNELDYECADAAQAAFDATKAIDTSLATSAR
jgi:hypothetical protein